jgi:predicted methyltransferase
MVQQKPELGYTSLTEEGSRMKMDSVLQRVRRAGRVLLLQGLWLLPLVVNSTRVHAADETADRDNGSRTSVRPMKNAAPSNGPVREVRKVKSPEGTMQVLEDQKRDAKEQPEKVLDTFAARRGETVADVGAGTGYFSFRLASRVEDGGKVFAVEIVDEMLTFIDEKRKQHNVKNLVTVKSSDTSPNLPDGCCDKVLMYDTYNYLADPVDFMVHVRRALKPGGSVAIVNRSEHPRAERSVHFRLAFESEVIDEMKRAGFTLLATHNILPDRYFLVFTATQ